MHGRGVCVAKGGMHGEGGCVAKGGVCGKRGGMHGERGACVVCTPLLYEIRLVNAPAVRILLECILVLFFFVEKIKRGSFIVIHRNVSVTIAVSLITYELLINNLTVN